MQHEVEFTFSEIESLTKAKRPHSANYIAIVRRRTGRFMPFSSTFAQSKMQTALLRFRTREAYLIFYDHNRCVKLHSLTVPIQFVSHSSSLEPNLNYDYILKVLVRVKS